MIVKQKVDCNNSTRSNECSDQGNTRPNTCKARCTGAEAETGVMDRERLKSNWEGVLDRVGRGGGTLPTVGEDLLSILESGTIDLCLGFVKRMR